MMQTAEKVNKICMYIVLAFFVSYSVLQSTALSLKLSNNIIIAVLFLLLVFQVALQLNATHLKLFSRDRKTSILKFVRPLDYVVLLFLLVNTIWIFLVPKLNGFAVGDAIREAGMLALFVLYFPLAILIRMKQINIQFLIRAFYWSIFALACLHIIVWVGETIHTGFFQQFINQMGSLHIFKTGDIISGWGIVRISVSNSILLGIGLILTFAHSRNLKPIDIICTVVFMTAIMCTFLRSLWLGVFCGLVLLFVYFVYLISKKRYIESRGMVFIVMAMIITAIILNFTVFQSSVSNRMENIFIHSASSSITNSPYQNDTGDSLNSPFNKAKDAEGALVSNTIKIEQTKNLVNAWLKKPLTGYGYGSFIKSYLRSKKAAYSYEMTTFSLLMKLGVVGFSIWVVLGIYVLSIAIKNRKAMQSTFFIWAAALVCFLVTIQTNPLLFSANALSFILYSILYIVYWDNKKTGEEMK